jgi:hypothetical protein
VERQRSNVRAPVRLSFRSRVGVVVGATTIAGGLAAVAGGGAARAAATALHAPSPQTVSAQNTSYGPAGTDDARAADTSATLAGTQDFSGSGSSSVYYFVQGGPDVNESALCTAGASQPTATGTTGYSCAVGHPTATPGTDSVIIYVGTQAGPPPIGSMQQSGSVNWVDGPTSVTQAPGTDSVPVGTCNAYQITVKSASGAGSPQAPVDVNVTTAQQIQDIPAANTNTAPAPANASSFCDPTAANGPSSPGSSGFTKVNGAPENPRTDPAPTRTTSGGGAETLTGEFTTDANGIVTIGVASSQTGGFTITSFVETLTENEQVGGTPCAAPQHGTQGQGGATATPGSATQEPCAASSKVFTAGSPTGVQNIGAAPGNATNVTGQKHTVTVAVCNGTVTPPSGTQTAPTCQTPSQPIPGATVTEQVSGVSGTLSGTCSVTDQQGQALCSYTGLNTSPPNDALTFAVPGSSANPAFASKTWVTGALALDADGGNDIPSQTSGCDQNADASASYNSGAIHHVCAKVTQGGNPPQGFNPVVNQTVAFTTTGIGGFVDCTSGNPTSSQSPSVNTDANGYAQVCVGSQFGGQQTVGASVGNGGTGKTGSVSITWTGPTAPTTSTTSTTISTTTTTTAPSGPQQGYTEVASDGGIFAFGKAPFFGSTGNIKLNKPIVGMTWTRSGKGYYLVASDGGVFAFGDAAFLGSTGNTRLNSPVVGMRVTPSGKGYYLVASDGGIFSFGDATFRGSTGAIKLNKPIVGMAVTPSGQGYWLAASDGGIFAFGDAPFLGSTGNIKLNSPVVGMAATSTGKGYWFVASDGGIFNFGDAAFFGSTGAIKLNKPIVAMIATPIDKGYWLVASDGGIFAFGDATFQGSMGGRPLNSPIVGGDAPPS